MKGATGGVKTKATHSSENQLSSLLLLFAKGMALFALFIIIVFVAVL